VRADGVGECAGWVGLFCQQMFSIGERERERERERDRNRNRTLREW